jgi:hypothetical protein
MEARDVNACRAVIAAAAVAEKEVPEEEVYDV